MTLDSWDILAFVTIIVCSIWLGDTIVVRVGGICWFALCLLIVFGFVWLTLRAAQVIT